MKKSTKQVLVGLLVAAVAFVAVCGALNATASTSTSDVLHPISLFVVLATWLVWSFRGHVQQRREQL